MDPFEEFEFKPLTDGLGFHKKKSSAAIGDEKNDNNAPSSRKILMENGLELIDEANPNPLRSPLPRKKATPELNPQVPLQEPSAVDEILRTLQAKNRYDFKNDKVALRQTSPKVVEYIPSSWKLSSSLLDGMLVVAASLLCLIIALVVTKIDLIQNLSHPDSQGWIYGATISLFSLVSFIYLTVTRMYLGWTPGEWAFDQRIGKIEELQKGTFSLKVLARSTLVIATGFVLLPALSILLKKDIAGALSGARLYKKA